MAVNVGNPAAQSPHHSFRAGPVLQTQASFQLSLSVPTLSTEKWPQCLSVQGPARKFPGMPSLLFGLGNPSSPRSSKSVVAVQVQINGRIPPQDAALTTHPGEHSPFSSCISPNPPSSEIFGNFVPENSVPLIQLCQGEFLENGMVYRQKYVIRSYQVGADKATSITTIFNFFQDVSLCHLHFMGIASRDGFGATNAMNRLGLIWVVAKMHVEVESFPKWPDVIEIDTSIARAGKHGARVEWIVRRYGTVEVLVRATSTWCMMDCTTRRVCKMPNAARAELSPFFLDDRHVFQQSESQNATWLSDRIPKLENLTAKYIDPALKSSRADLDVNQHVTNSSYISWFLQSVPEEHMETHILTNIAIEYRQECRSDDIFESLTSSKKVLEEDAAAPDVPGHSRSEFTHLLRTQDSAQKEIARARTTWRPETMHSRRPENIDQSRR